MEPRRPPRLVGTLLVASIALLMLFGVLAVQTYRRGLQRFTPDAELVDEVRTATLVEDEAATEVGAWPQWRGPRRDGVAANQAILTHWPTSGPPLAWRREIGEGYAGFAAARSRVYTLVRQGDKEVALCLDLETGTELWRFPYECRFSSIHGSGPRSTPCLSDGKLYTVGATGVLHCLDAATGKPLWRRDLLAEFQAPNLEWGVSFSPLVEGGLVFTNPGGANGNSLAALDAQTGEVKWYSGDDRAGYSSPVAATIGGVRQVVFFTGEGLVGVAADSGRELWRFAWLTDYHINAATPIVVRASHKGQALHYVFISSGYSKGCGLVKVERDSAETFQARPVYQGTQMRNQFSTCVRRGAYLYGFDEGDLVCMDLRTGSVAWKHSGFQKGSLMRAGETLIVLGEWGKLALVDASPEGYGELAAARPSRQRTWTMPTLVDGRLLVRDERRVYCHNLRPAEK